VCVDTYPCRTFPLLFVWIYRLGFRHSSRCMRLFVHKTMNALLQKKQRNKKNNNQGIGHASHKIVPPPYILHTISTFPRFASGPNPSPTSPRSLALIADPHQIPLGNPAFGRMSALNPPPVEIRYPLDRLPSCLHGGTTGPGQECPSPQPPRPPRLQRRNAGQHHPRRIHHHHPPVTAHQGAHHHFP